MKKLICLFLFLLSCGKSVERPACIDLNVVCEYAASRSWSYFSAFFEYRTCSIDYGLCLGQTCYDDCDKICKEECYLAALAYDCQEQCYAYSSSITE